MPWERMLALEGKDCFKPDDLIAVGFGNATLTKDGMVVYSEPFTGDNYMTGMEAEQLAAADPDHDWRIKLYAPLWDAVWQRHGAGVWAMIEHGQGFA